MSEASSILALSPEVHLSIISHLSLSNKRSLRLVSKTFNDLLCLDVPLADLKAAEKKKTIFLVENAKKGQLGREPFVILDVRKVRDDDDSVESESDEQPVQPSSRLLVDIYYPLFMRNDNVYEAPEEGWRIKINMERLRLDTHYKMPEGTKSYVDDVDYELLRGRLVKATAGLLRGRFKCPECGNGRNVCPGCGGFSERFPDLATGCGWSMPCPVCIGYAVASESLPFEGDHERLEKFWKKIDKMLESEKALRILRSKGKSKGKGAKSKSVVE
ncbi:hypothetical protein DFH06DRAFT_1298181 [Mycena polygramma]|nr:hypothetical protein DFH06DRAFT_1298181 [Mycena polygramma]